MSSPHPAIPRQVALQQSPLLFRGTARLSQKGADVSSQIFPAPARRSVWPPGVWRGAAGGRFPARGAPTNAAPGTFDIGPSLTVYYVPSTLGWTQFLSQNGLTGAIWTRSGQAPVISGYGLQNRVFGFSVTVAPNATVAVEACTDLSSPVWTALGTNAPSSGTFYFSDPDWNEFPCKFYRAMLP